MMQQKKKQLHRHHENRAMKEKLALDGSVQVILKTGKDEKRVKAAIVLPADCVCRKDTSVGEL